MKRIKVTYNPAYSDFFQTESRYAVLYGGAGSGKSYAAAQKFVYRCLKTPGERILVVRHVLRTCRASTFRLLRDVLRTTATEAAVNRSDLAITFPNGSQILHAGLDDVEKLKSIAGVTSIWIEEATEISEDDFHQLDLRLRGDCPTYRQVVLTFNPISRRHWLKTWMEAQDCYTLRTTHHDNKFVDDEYARVLSNLPDENFRAIYERGEWGEDVRGLIYPDFQVIPSEQMPDAAPDCYGLDFGFNNANALVALWLGDPYLVVDEVLYESHLTTPDLIRRMQDEGVSMEVPIYCDSARPDQIEELQRHGFYALPATKDVNAGIQSVKSNRLLVHHLAQNIINELHAYKWAEDRMGNPTDKPVKHSDHAMDAMRYGVHTHAGQAANWGLW